ncbi:hypothetical protein C942_04724 [Photobacterium marinum]|uniref:Uncharacterized protein n=2 Tax=Photobacterium marinum TaxID=1056511 RepID=L8J629_9GAMM|nr:hypothetical protein C942_04724 [Photobacterium marinum]
MHHLDCLVMANSKKFSHLQDTLPQQKYLLEHLPVYPTDKNRTEIDTYLHEPTRKISSYWRKNCSLPTDINQKLREDL